MKIEKCIDFSSSNLMWDGENRGIFKLISTLLYKNEKKSNSLFVLSESVLAGNVYANSDLMKIPPYLFQVGGSISEQIIFRTFLPNRKKKLRIREKYYDDSYGNPFFSNFQFY